MTPNDFPSSPPTVLASPKLMVWPDVTTFTLECYATVIPMFLNFGFESLSWQISLILGLVCLARKWHIQTGLNTNPSKYNLRLFRFCSSTHQWSQVDGPGLHMSRAGKMWKLSNEYGLFGCLLTEGWKENCIWSLETWFRPDSATCSFYPLGENTSN